MKKVFVVLSTVLLFSLISLSASAVQIEDFTMDFSVIDSDFGTFTLVDNINYDSFLEPNTWITQYLGTDGIIGNGDTFEETGFMNLSSLTPGGPVVLTDTDGSIGVDTGSGLGAGTVYTVNMYYIGLTGTISDYNDQGDLDPNNDTWKYSFDTGVGTVGWYLDDDYDPTNGTTYDILTGHVVPLSSGTADGFLSGVGASSNWDVTAEIDTYNYANFLLDKDGNDLWTKFGINNWLQTITTGDTTITSVTPGNDNTLLFIGATGDQTVINVVPEPSTFLLLGGGLMGLGFYARRRKK